MLPCEALSSPGAFKPTVERAPPSPARKDTPLGRTTLSSLFSCHGQGLCLSKNMWGVDCLPKASERVQSEELLCQAGDWRVWGGGVYICTTELRAAAGSWRGLIQGMEQTPLWLREGWRLQTGAVCGMTSIWPQAGPFPIVSS